jgi:hypothetical protein
MGMCEFFATIILISLSSVFNNNVSYQKKLWYFTDNDDWSLFIDLFFLSPYN